MSNPPLLCSSSQKLPAAAGDVAQVEILSPGAVDVGGNEALAAQSASWSNVVRLVSYYNYLGAIRADGTAACSFCDLSSDGRLLSENGRLFTDGGKLYLDPEYGSFVSEADLSRYTNIRDIVCCEGIMMLKNDGTVDWIEKLYTGCGCVYGLRRDGSVMVANCWDGDGQSNYMGWRLKELYVGAENLLGLTPEGKFVGDGDFSDYLLSSLNSYKEDPIVDEQGIRMTSGNRKGKRPDPRMSRDTAPEPFPLADPLPFTEEPGNYREACVYLPECGKGLSFNSGRIYFCTTDSGKLCIRPDCQDHVYMELSFDGSFWYTAVWDEHISVWLNGIRMSPRKRYIVPVINSIHMKEIVVFSLQYHPDVLYKNILQGGLDA